MSPVRTFRQTTFQIAPRAALRRPLGRGAPLRALAASPALAARRGPLHMAARRRRLYQALQCCHPGLFVRRGALFCSAARSLFTSARGRRPCFGALLGALAASPALAALVGSLLLPALPSPARASVPDALAHTAVLEAARSAEVCALLAAPVRQVRVEEGEWVTQGDTLVLLDDAEFDLAAARAQLAYQQRQSLLERAALLHARGGLSTQDLETVRYEAESARLHWDQARLELGRTVLTAPLAGQVAEIRVQVGRLTNAGQVLLVLVDPTDLQADLYLPAAQLAGVRLHQTVRATSASPSGRPLLGQVAHLSPWFDPRSGQARVRLRFPQAGTLYRPGQVVQVELGWARATADSTAPATDCGAAHEALRGAAP